MAGVEPWEWKGSSNGHSAVAGRQGDAASRGEGLICKMILGKGIVVIWGYFLHVRTSNLYIF